MLLGEVRPPVSHHTLTEGGRTLGIDCVHDFLYRNLAVEGDFVARALEVIEHGADSLGAILDQVFEADGHDRRRI